jgi:hypothetical protein
MSVLLLVVIASLNNLLENLEEINSYLVRFVGLPGREQLTWFEKMNVANGTCC